MQQYKYIKGSAEDFVGAPEWAMVAVHSFGSVDFAESHSRGARVHQVDSGHQTTIHNTDNWKLIAQRKPIPEPIPEWNGDGLPPVGIECEVLHESSWIPCVIVSHYDGFAFAWNYDKRITITVNEIKSSDVFRPLRTEAERKREDILRKLTDAICGDVPDVGVATAYNYAERVLLAIESGKIKLD